MPRKRTPGGRPRKRQSISLSGATYKRLRAYCKAREISITQLIETLAANVGNGGN
jgi:predicted DNA-binding ribbon-helix-helix protein